MSPTAQIIVASGIAGSLLLLGCIGVIWSLRCDPKRPHYRLPAFVAAAGPALVLLLVLLRQS